MSKRERHQKKEVEAVLQVLESLGWKILTRNGKGHAWGLLRCPFNDTACRCGEFCQMTINSTPQNPASHAAKLLNKASGCIRLAEDRKAKKT